MKLKQLTLQGYKTFPTKTDFLFDEGITAVVGPNGSGKSNIADALRWVLGEQSYGTLRGKRTVDMIFAGSQTRSRSGMAQATLTLDNSDGWLPIDYSEVEISRRAFRSGDNEYILNGQKVRLRDIAELLATSGLSERTYTIIGQGLIDRALSLRADERRALFEEAAGINHYKTRRAETLRRLNETQHNLERVQDILAEIKPRLNSLKRQATRARNYEQVNQDLRHLLRIWYGYKWDQARDDLRKARRLAVEAEKNWKKSRHETYVQQQNMDERQQQINRAQQRIVKLQEQRDDVRDQLEKARRQLAITEARQAAIHGQLADIEQEYPVLEDQRTSAQEQLLSATNELHSAQEQLEKNRSSLIQFRQSFQTQRSEIKDWQTKLATLEKDHSSVKNSLAQGQGQLSQLQERLRESEYDQDGEDAEQIEILVAEANRQIKVLGSARAEIKMLRQKRDDLQDKRKTLVAEIKKQRYLAKQEQANLNRQRDQVARLETKAELLDQLRHKEINITEDVTFIGSLASLLTIPNEYQIAIEAAVSERLATLVVEDSDSLWKLLESTENQSVSITSLQDIQTPAQHPVPDHSGVLGWASEFVTTSNEIQPIMRLLLGPVLLVDKGKTAYKLASSLPQGTLAVSSDGLVAHAGGLVESGRVGQDDGLLSREAAWQETAGRLEASELELQAKESGVLQLQENIQHLQEQIDLVQLDDRQLSRLENEGVQKLSVIQRRVDHNEQQRSYITRQKDRQNLELTRLHERIQVLGKRIASDVSRTRELEEALTEAQTKLKALPVAEAQQQQETLQQGIASAETIVAGRLAVVDSRRITLDQVDQQLNRLKQRRHSLLAQQEKLIQDDSSITQQKLQVQQVQIDEEIKPIRSRLIQYREELLSLQNKTAEIQRHAHEIETVYTQTQVRFTQQESQIESLQERIHNDLGLVALRYDEDQPGPRPLPITDVFDQLPKVDELPSDIEKTIQQYRGQMQRMGGVNPDAPAEYEETQERYDFMTQQVEDLNATEEQLRQVISELDELTSKAFADTVEKVNGVFGDTFTQLFGGGSARLVLTDPDDLTVSGVDIIARLPNRHEQGLGLLSGGERSLTASALIFSLLKVSPTPFCVLDEVDAALDEANINRFSDILRELSLKTQIIVITHNRGTVQAAQTIYGVSMQPDSASQVISIRPEEYVRQELI